MYYANGASSGSVPVDTNQYQPGNVVSVMSNGNLTNTAYHFGGWTNETGVSFTNGSTFVMGSANVNLYAVWTATVYVAGIDSGGNACYWTGTKQTKLNDCLQVYSIFVANGTVYTSGMDTNGYPCYWTGTNRTQLATYGYANSIYVTNGIVYTAGEDPSGNVCYWSNTTETQLTYSNKFKSATSIFVNNGIVYTSGIDDTNCACYWSNANEIPLQNGKIAGSANGIFVNNGIVYVAGNNVGGNAAYWTNGIENQFGFSGVPYEITEYNGTVYTTWRQNFICSNLIQSQINSTCSVYGIYLYNGTIYTTGLDSQNYPSYWTGTNKTVLNNGSVSVLTGYKYSIFVTY
jgi:hypothetical protein